MPPPAARTWSRRGQTPVIRVRGRTQRRFSIAALACYKPGERTRLIYRPKRNADHKRGDRRSFTWSDSRDLLTDAHQQLSALIVVIWDNLNVHRDARLREFIDSHDWISCYFLPAYAPDHNPDEYLNNDLKQKLRQQPQPRSQDELIKNTRAVLRKIHRSPERIRAYFKPAPGRSSA